jgi:cytochrome c biogenesis protein CcmG, thiol:disulfide interchange protein DsbE
MKVQSTGRPIGTLIKSPSNVSQPSAQEEKTASVSTEWVGLESKRTPLFKVPKKLGRNSVYLGAALLIFLIMIVIVIGLLQQKKKAAIAPTITIQATQVAVLPLAEPPTLAFSPSWTVSPTLTGTATATLTSAPTLTPTLEITRTPFPAFLVRPTPGFYPPDFTLPQLLSDHDVTLSQFFGKPILIFFWATWSFDCRSEINSLKTLQQNYADRGLVILAVNASESLSKVTAYQEANQLTYPVLLEQKNVAQIKYQVNSIPTHVFIDSEGKISYIHGGFMDLSQLENQVKAILP